MAQATWAIVRWTGRDTVPRHRGNTFRTGTSRAAHAALLVLAVCAVCTFPFAQSAHAQEQDTVLPESGIRYPGGFDPNTIGEVRGKASDLSRPERGPVRFRLVSDRDTYTVLACPPWMWSDLKVDLPDGTEVKVRGSKSLGKDGNLYVIAQEMELPGAGKSIAFRDGGGIPLWKGSPGRMMGTGRGMGSTMGGPGGMPSGRGGRGGRR
jgi:hypothetical protein